MSDLTQEEVDALTKEGVDGGRGPEAGPAAVTTLDLTKPERSLRGEMPGLELVLERLGRALGPSLRAFLGTSPEVAVTGVELVRFARVAERLTPPVCLQLMRLTPLRGQAVLVVPPPLAGAVLEVAFGGSRGRQATLEGRELSAIELRTLERLGTRVLQELVSAWRPIGTLEGTLLRSETNPAYATIAPQDLVALIELRIAVEGADDLGLSLCLPWAGLDPMRAHLAATPGQDAPPVADASWGERLRELLGDTELELTAELGRRQLSVRQVLALAVGDVVALGTGREGPVLVRVEGLPRFLGAPGISGTQHAVRLTARL